MTPAPEPATLRDLTAPSLLPELPEAAIVAILQRVPLRARLNSCALVCRAWAAEAVSAPANINQQLRSNQHCMQLQDWLALHGGVVVTPQPSGSAVLVV